ncbi:hypothetical protein KIN20_005435, partial [Parelaphostrongylus tenuis]
MASEAVVVGSDLEQQDSSEPAVGGDEGTPAVDGSATSESAIQSVTGFSTRYLNEKWIGRYDDTHEYVEYHGNQWRPLSEDDREFIQQLWYEQEAAEIQ